MDIKDNIIKQFSTEIPSEASCMPPAIDWQLVQSHAVVVPPSCVSTDEFPINNKSKSCN